MPCSCNGLSDECDERTGNCVVGADSHMHTQKDNNYSDTSDVSAAEKQYCSRCQCCSICSHAAGPDGNHVPFLLFDLTGL